MPEIIRNSRKCFEILRIVLGWYSVCSERKTERKTFHYKHYTIPFWKLGFWWRKIWMFPNYEVLPLSSADSRLIWVINCIQGSNMKLAQMLSQFFHIRSTRNIRTFRSRNKGRGLKRSNVTGFHQGSYSLKLFGKMFVLEIPLSMLADNGVLTPIYDWYCRTIQTSTNMATKQCIKSQDLFKIVFTKHDHFQRTTLPLWTPSCDRYRSPFVTLKWYIEINE